MSVELNASANRSSSNGHTPTRVVITGVGALTPVGLTMAETWESLLVGRSGIGPITRFDASELKTRFAGELQGFDPANYMERKEARRLDPYIQYAMAATKEALADSQLDLSQVVPNRAGCIIGTAIGGIHSMSEGVQIAMNKGLKRVTPFLIPNMLPDSAAGRIAIEYNLHGINHAVVSACASGTSAVGEAFEVLRRGDADVMVVGGSDSTLEPVIMAGFDATGALSTFNEDPKRACRPFDADRDGFVISEGAAVLIMETAEHALARGARIYAEVIGYGSSADAYSMVAPHENGRGAIDSMQMALRKAAGYGVLPHHIDYINAHGTSTRLNDKTETWAIKQVLGEHAYSVKISSTKSVTGHLLGGAGAFEAIVCAKVIDLGIIPPTINLNNPDPECDLDYTPHVPREATVDVALSNSFGFGGHNATVMLRRFS